MYRAVDAKINYILNMENNNNYNNEILAVEETTTEKKKCKCCGKELPLTMFNKRGPGYRSICISCERGESGASDKFKQFTSRELMEELRSRGFKGTFNRMKIETITI